MGKIINKIINKIKPANMLTSLAMVMMLSAANSRCMIVFHQPKQPDAIKKYRRF